MERLLFYYYNDVGTLIFDYYADGTKLHKAYIFYTLRQAVTQFRKDNNLQHKKIKIVAL